MADAPAAAGARRAGVWFALLVPGALAAGSLPISALVTPQPSSEGIFAAIGGATLTKALYLGDAPDDWPTGFPLGWYWTAALAACLLLTAAWYRHPGAIGRPASLRGYLLTGLALLVVMLALPLAGWTTLVGTYSPVTDWLDVLWQRGTFAELAIAVTLGILARALRSRALIVIAAVYAVVVSLAGGIEFQQGPISSFEYPLTGPYVVPAAVLVLAGAGAMLAAVVHPRRAARAGDDVRPAGT